MARNALQQFVAALLQHETAQTALWQDLAARAGSILMREALPNGKVPVTRTHAVRAEIEAHVNNLFLGKVKDGLAPFEIVAGRVVPRSPYFAALWAGVVAVTRIAVEQHAAMMERHLASAPDVLAALRMARQNPFAAAQRVSEQAAFRPRPFLSYDPLHRFVHEDGYTLSTRIWRVDVETRRRIDAFLVQGLAEGRGALEMSRDLERFLVPGRVMVRTHKPYGTTASYDAMRLARTEITAAHARAGYMSAQLNPFVTAYTPVLSHRHPKPDICDDEVAGGPYPITDQDHLPPYHPHCLCRLKWDVRADDDTVIEEMRGLMLDSASVGVRPAGPRVTLLSLIGPLLVDTFVDLLLGEPQQLAEEWV